MQICDRHSIMASYSHGRAHTTQNTVRSEVCLHTYREASIPTCGDTQELGPVTLYMTANRVGLSLRETANCSLPVSLKLGHHRALVPSPGPPLLPVHQETLNPN